MKEETLHVIFSGCYTHM